MIVKMMTDTSVLDRWLLVLQLKVPFQIFYATNQDDNRKPGTGMWNFFTEHCNGSVAPGEPHNNKDDITIPTIMILIMMMVMMMIIIIIFSGEPW